MKIEARVITHCVSEAKCSFRGGGSQSRACVRLAWGQAGRAPHHVPQHPVATQGQPMRPREARNLLQCEAGAWAGDMPSAPMFLPLLCSVKPKFTQAQFHLVATMFFWPWNLLLDWNLYCSQKKFQCREENMGPRLHRRIYYTSKIYNWIGHSGNVIMIWLQFLSLFLSVSKCKSYLLPSHSTANPAKACKPLCAISESLLWGASVLSLPGSWARTSPGYWPKTDPVHGRFLSACQVPM